MQALIAFWSHALGGALFGAAHLAGERRASQQDQRLLLAGFALTACWAWLTPSRPTTMLAAYAETARNLVWVGVLYSLSASRAASASTACGWSMPRSPQCSASSWSSTSCRS